MADSPDLAATKRLLDAAKDAGFSFQRIARGTMLPCAGCARASSGWMNSPRRVLGTADSEQCHSSKRKEPAQADAIQRPKIARRGALLDRTGRTVWRA